MSYCVCFTRPDGQVSVLRPNQRAVLALTRATPDAMLADLPRGFDPQYAQMLYGQMTVRTEQEAVRVIAAVDILRVLKSLGFLPDSATTIAICDETGLLHPTADLTRLRRFRRSWRQSGATAPAVDMPLARLQRMNEIRAERMPRLEKSDRDVMRAQEQANVLMQDRLKTYRQQLRDLPQTEQPNLDGIATPDALDAWRPAWPMDPVT